MTYHPPSTDILRSLSIKGDNMTSDEQALAAKMIAERAREMREGHETRLKQLLTEKSGKTVEPVRTTDA